MTESKITIDQLKNYLGTGLIVEVEYIYRNNKSTISVSGLNSPITLYLIMKESYEYVKPICYRLSDLNKFIPELGFVPAEKLEIDSCEVQYCSATKELKLYMDTENEWVYPIDIYYNIFQKLFEWNFWVFDQEYFEQGLVIDKLKHETNHV